MGLTIGLWALVIAATYLLGKLWGITATEMVGLGQTIIELLLIPIVVVGFRPGITDPGAFLLEGRR